MNELDIDKKVPMPKDDYYVTRGRKFVDSNAGFFGIWLVNAILFLALFSLFSSKLVRPVFNTEYIMPMIIGIIGLLDLVGITAAFICKRRYIAIGAIISLVLPLLAVGACFAIVLYSLSGMH